MKKLLRQEFLIKKIHLVRRLQSYFIFTNLILLFANFLQFLKKTSKKTALNIIGVLDAPNHGSVKVASQELTEMSKSELINQWHKTAKDPRCELELSWSEERAKKGYLLCHVSKISPVLACEHMLSSSWLARADWDPSKNKKTVGA